MKKYLIRAHLFNNYCGSSYFTEIIEAENKKEAIELFLQKFGQDIAIDDIKEFTKDEKIKNDSIFSFEIKNTISSNKENIMNKDKLTMPSIISIWKMLGVIHICFLIMFSFITFLAIIEYNNVKDEKLTYFDYFNLKYEKEKLTYSDQLNLKKYEEYKNSKERLFLFIICLFENICGSLFCFTIYWILKYLHDISISIKNKI